MFDHHFKFPMDSKDCYKIGFVLKTHGLKGQVTVAFDPDHSAEMETADAVFMDIHGDLVPFFIESISLKGTKAYVKFEDVDSLEAAERIAKKSIFLPKSDRPKAGRGEFYDDEVSGFDVIDQNLGKLGKVREIVNAGPNRLLALDYQEKEILIPVNSPFIVSLNKSKKLFTVNLPDGFLDI